VGGIDKHFLSHNIRSDSTLGGAPEGAQLTGVSYLKADDARRRGRPKLAPALSLYLVARFIALISDDPKEPPIQDPRQREVCLGHNKSHFWPNRSETRFGALCPRIACLSETNRAVPQTSAAARTLYIMCFL
jgi:hypothetical protein